MREMALFVAIGAVFIFVISPMFVRGVDVFRPVLDAKGQQGYDAYGRPKLESDPLGQFMVNWDAYAVMAVGGVCILYGIGGALLRRVRGSSK